MKITTSYREIVYVIGIIILIYFVFQKPPTDTVELDRVKFERDSIISAVIDQNKLEADNYHRLADSCRNAIKTYEKADSINHYKSRYERSKIKRYTPTERDRVRDSIYRAAGIQTGSR